LKNIKIEYKRRIMQNLNELKKFTEYLAQESGYVIRDYFRTDVNIESKQDESPVTIADKQTEELLRDLISKEFPGHGILGEEFGTVNENAEYQWVLDPIDGTKSFISGALSFGTLIALMHNGEPILGAFYQPIIGEFLIGDNSETTLNGEKVEVRNCDSIEQATFLTTDHLNVEKYQNMEKFEKLIRKVKLYRNWGDCYGYYLVATGFADVMMDPVMSAWDTMALIPIIKGAKGVITDYHGNDPVKGDSVIAASPGIHQKIVEELN
jgi:myo-inositol-1(or 4)-monophosphatase